MVASFQHGVHRSPPPGGCVHAQSPLLRTPALVCVTTAHQRSDVTSPPRLGYKRLRASICILWGWGGGGSRAALGNLTGQGTKRPLVNSHVRELPADSPGQPSLWLTACLVDTMTVTPGEALSQTIHLSCSQIPNPDSVSDTTCLLLSEAIFAGNLLCSNR